MIKKLLFLIVFTAVNCYSQTKFERGHFITNTDQKIVCEIKNLDWRYNPVHFEYRLLGDPTVQQGSIAEVKEFAIDNTTKYIRQSVDIDRSSEQLSVMSTDKNPIFKNEQLFLMVLIEGAAKLYEYRGDGNLKRFFYSKGDDEIKQLVFKTYKNTPTTFTENNYYRQQLWNDLKCDDITLKEIERLDYRRDDLVDFFTEYNTCTNSSYEIIEKNKTVDFFNLSVRGHVNSISASITNSESNQRSVDFGTSVGYSFGIEAEFVLGFNNNKWAVIVEPTYQSYNANKTENSTVVSGGKIVGDMEYSSIELPVGVRHYFFLNSNSKLFVNASLIYDVVLKSEVRFSRIDGTTLGSIGFDPKINMGIGAGYKYKNKYSMELRMKTNRELFNGSDVWSSDYNVMSLIIGYSIF